APPAQSQGQRIEQDGLAGAGLAGQHGHAAVERQVELVDEDDIANRKRVQHARIIPRLVWARGPLLARCILPLPAPSRETGHRLCTNEPGRILAPRNKLATNSSNPQLRRPAIQLPLLTAGARPCLPSISKACLYQVLEG